MIASILKLASRPAGSDRTALRKAIADRRRAEEAHEAAKAATARVQSLIDALPEAERVAEEAEAAARLAARDWAAGGAVSGADDTHKRAISAALDAQARAAEARILAKGAEDALPELQQAERESNRGSDLLVPLRAAIGPILLEHADPPFERLRRAIESVRDLLPELRGAIAEVLAIQRAGSSCGAPGKYAGNDGLDDERFDQLRDQRNELKRAFDDAVNSDAAMRAATTRWERFVERLSADADATIE